MATTEIYSHTFDKNKNFTKTNKLVGVKSISINTELDILNILKVCFNSIEIKGLDCNLTIVGDNEQTTNLISVDILLIINEDILLTIDNDSIEDYLINNEYFVVEKV